MTKDEAVVFAPIIKAFGEGKTIQFIGEDEKWHDFTCGDVVFADNPSEYRIKPEAKYRPFANAQECWNEMLKHQPFGWVKKLPLVKDEECLLMSLTDICDEGILSKNRQKIELNFTLLSRNFSFCDGAPCGIEEGGEQ